MQYPNIGAPSPQEIYDALKMIPNNAQGKQMLGQLAQQGKQTGSIEGGIATALLNSYNKAQQVTPPPPQGTVADQVIAQAQPPMPPAMQGIAMPGLEGVAQQNAQQMATGGIVALAQGGPVREFDWGGVTDLAQDSPWMGGMPDVPEAPDTTAVEQDYFAAPHPAPKAIKPAAKLEEKTTEGTKAASPSFEEQMNAYTKALGVPPDVAAELISSKEHEKARREKFNAFEVIGSGLGSYLASYGSGAHRAGAGIASMLSTMGEHRREEAKADETIDALRRESMMHDYSTRNPIAAHLIGQMESSKAAAAKSAAEMAKTQFQGNIDLAKAQIGADGDLAVQELRNKGLIDDQALQNLGSYRVEQLKQKITRGELSPNDVASIINKAAEDITIPMENRMANARTSVQTARELLGGGSGLGGSGYTSLGGGMYLSGSPTS